MGSRHSGARHGLWSFGVGAAICVANGMPTIGADNTLPRAVARLEILLSTPPKLPDSARSSLIGEVTTIWGRERVTVEWSSSAPAQAPMTRRLRVLVIPGDGAASPAKAGHYVRGRQLDNRPETVGELLRSGNGHVVAIVSLDTAERIVGSAQRRIGPIPDALYYHRLGLVLGRAVAHEIGHYLLDTSTHTQSGLMRARFDAREFTDARSGPFFLDRKAAAWLKSRIARVPVALAR